MDAFFLNDTIHRRRVPHHMCPRMRGERVFKKFESKLRTNGRTNERTNDGRIFDEKLYIEQEFHSTLPLVASGVCMEVYSSVSSWPSTTHPVS